MLALHRLLLATGVIVTIGCSYAAFEGVKEVQTVVESNAVKSLNVTLEVADVWQLKVGANPTTGYEVKLNDCDIANGFSKFLELYLGTGGYEPKKTDVIGSGGYNIYMLRAIKAGQTCVLIEWKQPWSPDAKSVKVYVAVTPKSLIPDASVNMTDLRTVPNEMIMHRVTVMSTDKPLNVTLAVDEGLELLVGNNPTTGYEVKLNDCDIANGFSKFLELYLGTGGYEPKKTDVIGSGGYNIFMLRAIKAGQTCVLIEWKQPWSPDAKSVKVYVTVTPNDVNDGQVATTSPRVLS